MTQEMTAEEYQRLFRPTVAVGARARQPRKSELEEHLARAMAWVGLPTPEREYRFRPSRRWRADFAWPELRILVECEGGTSEGNRGRHMRQEGFERDTEKYTAASADGWTLLRFTRRQIRSGAALTEIERVIRLRKEHGGNAGR